jgi:hypothetical protein
MKLLPPSPKHPGYQKILDWTYEPNDPAEQQARFRCQCEDDFWFFVRYACSFGKYTNQEPGHPMAGEPWAEHPWVFKLCRELQQHAEEKVSDFFYNLPRFSFKTELVTKCLTIWELLRDPSLTIIILTYKVDQTGVTMFEHIRKELEKNEILLTHWPDVLSDNIGEYPLWTNSAFTVKRPLGPREPSVSIHSVLAAPTSFHPRRIVIDDAVVRETVENAQAIDRTNRAIKALTPLNNADTITRWVGTIWDIHDPYMEGLENGLFSGRSEDHSCYDSEGKGVLHTEQFLATWARKMGNYLFSANMLNDPVAKGDQNFRPEWLDYQYRNPPIVERIGKNVYIFSDVSSGEEASDFTAVSVVGLGEDRKYYMLDLVRDRLTLNDLLDVWFTLAKKWKPEIFWVESFGDTAYFSVLKREMDIRRVRFSARKIPRIGSQRTTRSKEQRIVKLQPMMARGEIWWPADGFGHGSMVCGDERDTFEQLRREEYQFWTPVKNSVLHDDALDSMSWIAQPEMQKRLSFPETVLPEESDPFHPDLRRDRQRNRVTSAVSGWAF